MKKKLLEIFLSDALLIGFATFTLFLLILIWAAPEHSIGIGESNQAILTLETLLCITTIVGTAQRIVHNIQKERQQWQTR